MKREIWLCSPHLPPPAKKVPARPRGAASQSVDAQAARLGGDSRAPAKRRAGVLNNDARGAAKKRRLSEVEVASVSEQNERLWTQRKFTDAEFVVNPGQSRKVVRFPVHRNALCAASPVFDAAFSAPLKKGAAATFSVKDYEPAAVEAMLRFIYTGMACAPGAELEPSAVLELAIHYQIDRLVVAAAEDLFLGMTAQNVGERARVLKGNKEHASLAGVWDRFFALVKKDDALLEALI